MESEGRGRAPPHRSSHNAPLQPALRESPWKFVPSRGSGGFSAPKTVTPGDGKPAGQLYNLASDPRETRYLAAEQPEVVARMSRRLTELQASTRARPQR